MRYWPFTTIRLAIVLGLVLVSGACDDDSTGGGGLCCGNPNPPPPLPAGDISRFSYVANTADNTLSIFLVDSTTGRLTPIGYVLTGDGPVAVATDPDSKYIYVANRDDDTVSAFVVDEHTGALSEMADSPYPTGAEPVALLVTPNGNSLYVANRTGESISAFTINGTDGSLTVRPSAATSGRSPTSLAVDATGSFLFIGNSEIGADPASVGSFAIDSVTGDLSSPNGLLVGDGALSITLHPSGDFLYAVSDTAGEVALLSVLGGNLAVISTAVTAGVGATAITFTAAGDTAYVINGTDPNPTPHPTIRQYSVAGDGTLTEGDSVDLASSAVLTGIKIDPLGERLYILNSGTAEVSVYDIDVATSALTAASTTRSQRSPQGLALVTRGAAATAQAQYALILNQGTSTISSYSVNATTGTLSTNGPQSLSGGLGTPRALAVDPLARFVYVAHDSNVISAYRINAANGSLPSIATVTPGLDPSVTVSIDPQAITIEPSGRYAYAAGSVLIGGQVVVLTIDQTTGALTEIPASGLDTGRLPVSIATDPTGRFLYVVNSLASSDLLANTISMFSINTATGLLTSVGPEVGVNDDPRSVAVDGSGRFAYVVSAGTDRVQGFAIDPATGALTSVMSPLATGTNPQAVATDPTGRFVYAANATANNIRPYTIDIEEIADASMGELSVGTVSTSTGSGPTALAVEPGGRFVYVTNQVSNSLATYSINQTSGNLSRVDNASIPSGVLSTPIAIGLTLSIE